MNHTDVIPRPSPTASKPRLHGLVNGRAVYSFRRQTNDRTRRFEAHVQIAPELHAWVCAYGRSRRQAVRQLRAELVNLK